MMRLSLVLCTELQVFMEPSFSFKVIGLIGLGSLGNYMCFYHTNSGLRTCPVDRGQHVKFCIYFTDLTSYPADLYVDMVGILSLHWIPVSIACVGMVQCCG